MTSQQQYDEAVAYSKQGYNDLTSVETQMRYHAYQEGSARMLARVVNEVNMLSAEAAKRWHRDGRTSDSGILSILRELLTPFQELLPVRVLPAILSNTWVCSFIRWSRSVHCSNMPRPRACPCYIPPPAVSSWV